MAHNIIKTDPDAPQFEINAVTRAIKNNTPAKIKLIQHDHNSEIFSFSMPRYIEGHNMLECNKVEVHYINIDAATKEEIKGLYVVKDMAVDTEDANNVCFSWLISNNATRLVGNLSFLIRFSCVQADGAIDYAWNTDKFTQISVSSGINNSEYVAEKYADVLAQWEEELFSASTEGVENIYKARNEAVAEVKKASGVAGVVEDISEKIGTRPDTTNLWTLGDVSFTRQKRVAIDLPAGSYTFSMFITTTDTDHATSCNLDFRGGGKSVLSRYAKRNDASSFKVTLPADVDAIDFYAGTGYANSEGDTATFSNISIIDNNATIDVYTAKDEVARSANADFEYIQKPNLYDGAWELGRYVYETGKKYTGEASSHCRNVNPVPLDPEKGYNLAVKSGHRTQDPFYVYRYDAEMNFLSIVTGKANSVVHIEGASFVCFHIAEYGNRYPDTPLNVMVWECDNENQSYTEWLEYGEKGSYTKSKLLIEEENIAKAMLSRDRARFDDSFNYIAYSNVTDSGYWINSVEHFKWAAKQPFTALKGDVQPTSDGVLVMCHDDGFSLNDAGQVVSYNASTATPIHSMTSEQCLALLYNGGTQHICSFDEYVKTCKKYGKIAFITIRNNYMEEVVPALFSVLDKYNMRKRCIINSFTFGSLQAVRNVDNNITLHQVLNSGETISISAINRAIELGNCMIGGFSFPNLGRFDVLDASAVEYAKANDIRLYVAMVSSMEDIDLLMEHGISGAQMLIVPNLE